MKKLVALILVLLLCSAMILSASADAFIPPDDNCNYNLLSSPYFDGDCYALNIFLSNYAETQLTYYEIGSGNGDAFLALMKHFELNPKAYKKGTVTSFTGADGVTYMRIDGDRFEDRMEDLFSIDIDVESCHTYYDGDIVASAENLGAPIRVFASAEYCDYLGNYLYRVAFQVYKCNGDVSGKYGIANQNLSAEDGEVIGSGYANFYYYGSRGETEFHNYDFVLSLYALNKDSQLPPYGNENKPYVEFVEESTEAPTESTVEVSTQETAAPTEPVEETEQSSVGETLPTEESVKGDLDGGNRISLALVLSLGLVAIIVMTLTPLVIILVVFHRKKP